MLTFPHKHNSVLTVSSNKRLIIIFIVLYFWPKPVNNKVLNPCDVACPWGNTPPSLANVVLHI